MSLVPSEVFHEQVSLIIEINKVLFLLLSTFLYSRETCPHTEEKVFGLLLDVGLRSDAGSLTHLPGLTSAPSVRARPWVP